MSLRRSSRPTRSVSEGTAPFSVYFRQALLICTGLGALTMIPNAVTGLTLKSLLLAFGSSYSIGLSATLFAWLILRRVQPIFALRGWPSIRSWAVALLGGCFIANSIYSIVFSALFVTAGKRLQFWGFWQFAGVVLSLLASGVFVGIELVQRELAKGRAALRSNAALAEELRLAQIIQQRFLPKSAPHVTGLQIAGGCYPAREVGGDLLSYQMLDGERVCISVGDVTGKSVGAAMLMGVTLGALQAEIHDHQNPALVMDELDRWLRSQAQAKTFVALSIALVDVSAHTLTLANAGQLAPILRRRDQVRLIEEPAGLPLGMGPPTTHQYIVTDLQAGDLLLFYTDGVVEAQNEAGELWGFERLMNLVGAGSAHITPAAMMNHIHSAIADHVGAAEQHDDWTLVVVRVG